ncbi:unnamed protein product [Trifolium pratense]|uniref:Uncharacterized protein n=1 Tax=Trifolium pratense TaxID=57577 RepID=A0ACB0J452_TRIPR|nr:unnamed protein product [Trifolium pratense]
MDATRNSLLKLAFLLFFIIATDMFMESEAYCKTDHDCRKPSVIKELDCPVQQPPVCFNNECACDPSNPPKQKIV